MKDGYTVKDLESYHTRQIRTLSLTHTDPSLVIAFLCRSQEDFEGFCSASQGITSGKTPLFTIEDCEPDYQTQEVDVISDEDCF